MLIRNASRLFLAAAGIALLSQSATAQGLFRNPYRAPTAETEAYRATRLNRADNLGLIANRVTGYTRNTVINSGPVVDFSSTQKPFSQIYRRPVVSPYLNLDRNDGGAAPNYFTLVQPQLQQQRYNQQQARRIDRLQREVGALQSTAGFTPFANEGIRATGHAATFMNTSHYFPQ
jgi:hypothetical protein